jgi:DNA transposition AAA+ family ATPase
MKEEAGFEGSGGAYDEKLYKQFFDLVGPVEEGKKVSQSKAAQVMGISPSVISAYKGRNYAGNVRGLEEKMAAWLKREARRLRQIEIPLVETVVTENVRMAIAAAQDNRDVAVIVGEAGSGKTTALEQYVRESYSAILIDADPSVSQTALMAEIARQLGVDDKGGGANAVIARVIETLKGRDAVVIVDEAGSLSDKSLSLLRRVINDKAQTGVVLVGLPDLKHKLLSRQHDQEQLVSRVGMLLHIGHLTKADAEKIIAQVWKDLPKDTVDAFVRLAGNSTRTLVKLIIRSYQLLDINHTARPDADLIAKAASVLMR